MGIQVIDLRKLVIVGILNGKKLNSNSIECSCLVCGYFSDPLRFKRFLLTRAFLGELVFSDKLMNTLKYLYLFPLSVLNSEYKKWHRRHDLLIMENWDVKLTPSWLFWGGLSVCSSTLLRLQTKLQCDIKTWDIWTLTCCVRRPFPFQYCPRNWTIIWLKNRYKTTLEERKAGTRAVWSKLRVPGRTIKFFIPQNVQALPVTRFSTWE